MDMLRKTLAGLVVVGLIACVWPANLYAASHTVTATEQSQGNRGVVYKMAFSSLAAAAADTGTCRIDLANVAGILCANSSGVPVLNFEIGWSGAAAGVDSAKVAILFSSDGSTWWTAYTQVQFKAVSTGASLTAAAPRKTFSLANYPCRYMKLLWSNSDASSAGAFTGWIGFDKCGK